MWMVSWRKSIERNDRRMKDYALFIAANTNFFFVISSCLTLLPVALGDLVPHDRDKMVLSDFLAHDYWTLSIKSILPMLFDAPTISTLNHFTLAETIRM